LSAASTSAPLPLTPAKAGVQGPGIAHHQLG
jgi:hypothetical protein